MFRIADRRRTHHVAYPSGALPKEADNTAFAQKGTSGGARFKLMVILKGEQNT